MTRICDATSHQLHRGEPLSEAGLQHLAQCTLCQDIAEIVAADSPNSSEVPAQSYDVAELLQRTESVLAEERGILPWLRSRSLHLQLALAGGSGLVSVALQLALAPRSDLTIYPMPRLALLVAAHVIAFALAAKAFLHPLYRPKSARWEAVIASVAFILPVTALALVPAGAASGVVVGPLSPLFFHQAIVCLRHGALLALPTTLLLLAMRRQLAAERSHWLMVAGMGGLLGNLLLQLHCANPEPLHQLLGHATVGVVLFGCVAAFLALVRRGNRRGVN